MKRCPQCAEKIQDAAKICRYCGATQPEIKGNTGTLLLVIGGVFLVAAVVNAFGGEDQRRPVSSATEPDSTSSSKARDDTMSDTELPYADVARQYAWIEKGKEQIKLRLKDPDSAEFRDVHFYSGGGVPVACGEVNSKNSFGGYTGFERFIAAGSQLAVVESDMTSPSELDEVWHRFCTKAASDGA